MIVGVSGIPEANRKLLRFDAQLKALASSDPTVTLRATVDHSGFDEFEALKAAAGMDSTAEVHIEATGIDVVTAQLEAIRAMTKVPIVQEVKLEIDRSSLAALGAADLVGHVGGVSSAHPVGAPVGVQPPPSQAQITQDMVGLRQWTNSHETFWDSTGPPGGKGGAVAPDASAALDSFLAEMAAKGRTGDELLPGQWASRAPQMDQYYRHFGYEPAFAPDRSLRLYGPGGAPGSSNFGIAPGAVGEGPGAAGGGGFWSSLAASVLGDKAAASLGGAFGAGGGGRGILGSALWGGGGSLPFFGKVPFLAGALSLGSMAGLGAEHLLFTGLGLAGSAGGAMLGGGLIGAGALGTMAVGGGSDLAVMKSTLTGVKELTTKYDALQQAVKLYGAHSRQAAQASAELHLAMSEIGPAAKSEMAVARQGEALSQFWGKATTDAKVQASHIMSQVLGLGNAYVPLVAHAADQNLAIIDKDLKPLFAWLKGPEGTGIFEHLEEVFAHNLPNAMGALDQGVQFFLKTISVASNYTGGFVESIDDFFTKWNEPQNFQKWETEIGHLVGDFHLWMDLIKQLGVDIFDLFSNDAHTGNTIVRTLDGMLVKLHEWETSTSGKHELHNLFVVHKEEIVALLHLIPEFVSAIEPIYMTMAPFLTGAMTEVLGDFGSFLKLLDETGPITRFGLGLGLIAGHLIGFKTVFAGLGKAMWAPFESLLAKDPLIGGFFKAEEDATEKLTAATDGLTTAVDKLTASYEAMGTAAQDATDSAAAATGGATGASEVAAGATAGSDAAAAGFAGTGAALPVILITAGTLGAMKMAEQQAKIGGRSSGGDHVLPSWMHAEGLEELIGLFGGGESSHAARAKANRHQKSLGLEWLKSEAELTSLRHHFADTMEKIHADAGTGIGAIDKALGTGLHQADETWMKGTSQWKGHTADAMHEAVEAIRAGMNAGTIDVSEGHRRINELLIQEGVALGHFHNEIMGALHEGDAAAIAEGFGSPELKISKAQRQAGIADAQILGRLKSGYVVELEQIKALLRKGSEESAKAFQQGSPEWREATADNMHAAVEAIRAGEQDGYIAVEQGNKEIAALIKGAHVVTGDDPFGIAASFVHSWEKAGGANRHGISLQMRELEQMPQQMRDITVQMELVQVRHAEQTGTLMKGSYARLRSAVVTEFGLMALKGGEEAKALGVNVVGPFGEMDSLVREAVEDIGGNTSRTLEALGSVTLPHFHLKSGQHLHHMSGAVAGFWEGHERGGHIDLGAPSGDSVPAMLERDEYVLNRRAVAAVGVPTLDALNFGVAPRHLEKGGHAGGLGGEPRLEGHAGALRSLGQAAIHAVYQGAEHYLHAHGPTAGGAGSIAMPGGGGSVVAEIARVLFANGFNKMGATGPIGNSYAESTWDPAAMEPGTHNGGLWGFTTGEKSLASLEAYGAGHHTPWTDVALQTAFMLKTGGLGLRARLNAAKSPAEAARIFEEGYEAAGIVRMDVREEGARKAFAMGYAEGGLVGQAERERGLEPTRTKTRAEKATPTMAVNWEMRHLGQSEPWNSEDPGDWCGDFQAAGMRAIGLTPPPGFPAAFAWTTYGTPLGKSNMQGGAIIVYGHQHVAMAADSSKMVSGNWGGVVATSPIEATVGGTPITAVRWPHYGHGPGAGSAPTEKVPGTFHGAHTGSLNFPSVPSTLHGVAVEMHRWHGELQTYENAVHLATGRPELQRKIQANVTAIQKYLRELERARHKLRGEAARKRYSAHLTRQLGHLTGEEKSIELAQRAYAVASQYAEQVVSLEPREPTLKQPPENATEAQVRQTEEANHGLEVAHLHAYEAYVGGSERPAYLSVLEAEAGWRNTILSAESKATGMETAWENQIRTKAAEIETYERYGKEVEHHLDHWRASRKQGEAMPSWLKDELANRKRLDGEVPGVRLQEHELEKVVGEARQEFYGGFQTGSAKDAVKVIDHPAPPMAGSGQFEQALQEVQGIHWPKQHEYLGVGALMPPRHAGSFGGAIWSTQTAMEELGLQVEQAQAGLGSLAGPGGGSSSTAAETERTQLLEELLRQANEEKAIDEITRQTLHGAHVLPYAGGYESGGMVAALVGEQGPEIIATRPGAYIHNSSETSNLLSPQVVINHYEGEGRYEVEVGDQKVEAVVNRMDRRGARVARRGLARAGF